MLAGKVLHVPENQAPETASNLPVQVSPDVSSELANINKPLDSRLEKLRQQLSGYETDRNATGQQVEALGGRVAELSARIDGISSRVKNAESAGNDTRQEIETLCTSLAETTSRVDGTDSRIAAAEAAYDTARQQITALDSTLTETVSSLDGMDSRITAAEAAYDTARLQIAAFESTLTKTVSSLDGMDSRIAAAEAAHEVTLRRVETLASASSETASRLTSAEKRISALDLQLEKERANHQAAMQKAQEHSEKQQRRSRWLLILAGYALIQGAVAGVVWARNYSEILAGIKRDILAIRTSLIQLDAGIPDSLAVEYTTARVDEKAAVKAPSKEQLFFEKNALKPEVIVLDSGLQYKVIERGTGLAPGPQDMVEIDYRGRMLDGTEFISTTGKDPASFPVNRAPAGLRETFRKMDEGAHWEVYVPSALMGSIRKAAIYDIRLLSIVEPE